MIPADNVQVEVSISPSTSTITSPGKRGHDNRELKAALSSWLRQQSFRGQDQRGPKGMEASNVKISVQMTRPPRKRISRYLREKDRREIIKRIRGGEQQITLAKEFGVSRAAICNLYKNRQEILARATGDPQAVHPKKVHATKATSDQTGKARVSTRAQVERYESAIQSLSARYHSPRSDSSDDGADYHQDAMVRESWDKPHFIQNMNENAPDFPEFTVHEAAAHSYPCRNLVASLRDEGISSNVFQQRSSRLARLVIEEALSRLPHDTQEVMNQYGDMCRVIKPLNERDICGVSMEGRGSVLLRAFSEISPTSPAGIVSLDLEDSTSGDTTPRVKAHLATVRPDQVVLLFDIQCTTGDATCAVLHHLVHDRKIRCGQIYFTTIISSFEGLQKVSRLFPGVTLITAQMDVVVDEHKHIRPGIGDFMQRYWNFVV